MSNGNGGKIIMMSVQEQAEESAQTPAQLAATMRFFQCPETEILREMSQRFPQVEGETVTEFIGNWEAHWQRKQDILLKRAGVCPGFIL